MSAMYILNERTWTPRGATDHCHRECCMGALCNVACKAWINAETFKEIGLLKTLLKGIRVSLVRAEDA